MEMFGTLDLAGFRRSIQKRPLEEPFRDGREKVHVMIWCKKSPTGENIGLMVKCEVMDGKPAPVVLVDLDIAKKYLFLVREEVPTHSVFLTGYDRKLWPYPKDVKVLVLKPEDVTRVRVSQEFAETLDNAFDLNRAN